MSDTRTKVHSSKASPEVQAVVARQLGFKPAEVLAVFDNVDGLYALVKDGHRLLLQDDGEVAWYGDEAPNPGYPLVVPSVELDESDDEVDEVETPAETHDEGGPAKVAVPPKHGAGSGKDVWAAYAAEHRIEVPEGATREQIWQSLEQANVPTE